MQRTLFRGRGASVRDSIRAKTAGVEVILAACCALAAAMWTAAPSAAATFDPVAGTLSAKAGSQATVTKPAVIGGDSAISQVASPLALGQSNLVLEIPNSSRFKFSGSASSTTTAADVVTASYSFTQRFNTTTAQWMELRAKVRTNPFGTAQATALATLRRVGAGADAFSIDYTFDEFETAAGAFAAGSFDLKNDVFTTVTAGPNARSGGIEGDLLIAGFADFNNSGAVNSADLTTWSAGFGMTSGTFANGNLDDNPAVDGRDFLLWQRQAGSVTPGLPVGTAVPEPGAAAMLFALLAAMRRGRGR